MSTPIDISEEAGVRYLHFGSEWIQGAMRLKRPNDLELAYTREMMAGLLLREPPWPRRVLLIGLGSASLTRFIRRRLPDSVLDVVEIEPAVVAACKQFFQLPPSGPKLQIHVADGAEYILRTPHHYDLILVDGFDREAKCGALITRPFYDACAARLTEQGIVAINLFSNNAFAPTFDRIAASFADRVLSFPSGDHGNIVTLAAAGEPIGLTMVELRERAAELKAQCGLDLLSVLSRIEQAGTLPGGVLQL